jgi:hypothetical protein
MEELDKLKKKKRSNALIGLVEVGWGNVDWIDLGSGYGQMKSSCEFGIEPSGSIKFWEPSSVLTTGDLSSSAQLHRVMP